MLRYDRQTKPGLVALYDIRPGNRAGPFLQPRSPHGALPTWITMPNFIAVDQTVRVDVWRSAGKKTGLIASRLLKSFGVIWTGGSFGYLRFKVPS